MKLILRAFVRYGERVTRNLWSIISYYPIGIQCYIDRLVCLIYCAIRLLFIDSGYWLKTREYVSPAINQSHC